MSKPRAIIIGEAPNTKRNGNVPFEGSSGRRLVNTIGECWRMHLDSVNLLPAQHPNENGIGFEFDSAAGHAAAKTLVASVLKPANYALVLLAGKRVASAFGYDEEFWMPQELCVDVKKKRFARLVIVPHPSGTNRWWNDPGNRDFAAKWFRTALAIG